MKTFLLMLCFATFACGAYENFKAAYTAGRKAYGARQYAESVKIHDEALKMAKHPYEIYQSQINASDALMELKDYDGAIKRAEAILAVPKMDPHGLTVAYNQIANAQYRQNKVSEAMENWKKAIGQNSGTWAQFSAYAGLGSALRVQKKYDEAVKCYTDAQNHAKATPQMKFTSVCGLFYLEMERKNYAAAAKYPDSADELVKGGKTEKWTVARAKLIRGNLLFAQNKYAEAIPLFEAAAGTPDVLSYDRSNALNAAADCALKIKDYAKAKALLDKNPSPNQWLKKQVEKALKEQVK